MSFEAQLAEYKRIIDADIAVYAAHVQRVTREQYGTHPGTVTDAYIDVLTRGGKRIRGALVLTGYALCGGTNPQMITRAATAFEMMHTSMLIVDDIQDRSRLRRGKQTLHEELAVLHQKEQWQGDAAHTGASLALNAALGGMHAAHMLLSGLSVEPELRVNVLGIVNYTLAITLHGQTQDIANEVTGEATMTDVEHVQEWKTAQYTVLNPLCAGMVLAGAGCEDTNAIREYALHTGKAFQITDDILGLFGSDTEVGKRVGEDIMEGKRTLLTVYALKHAAIPDRQFLRQCLGNVQLSADDSTRCRHIIEQSGGLAFAQDTARQHVEQAQRSLDKYAHRWPKQQVTFLRQLAAHVVKRNK